MTSGVIYFLCGNWRKYLGPLLVSLHSLRKWWDGPVSVCITHDLVDPLRYREIPSMKTFDGATIVPLAPVRRHAHYVTKAILWRHSPFDQTILLDADTICTGPIEELFNAPLTVTKFSNWVTTGKIVGGRIAQWEKRGIRASTAQWLRRLPHPAINTGVVGWNRDAAHETLEEWEALSLEGWQCSFTDELAMQILLAESENKLDTWLDLECRGEGFDRPFEIRLVDDRYNCSPVFGVNREDARIWHYHGRRMVRRPEAAALYRPHLLAALDANAGGIADWLEKTDPPLWDLAKRSQALAT